MPGPAQSEPKSARGALRHHMGVVAEWAFFDHAAVSPLPDVAAQAIAAYVAEAQRLGSMGWRGWADGVETLRTTAATLIGASPDEMALVANTTHGIGLVAEGFPWQPGDNVVVPENEFPSNLLPWRMLARRGVELRSLPVATDGVIDLERLADAIDARTKILSLSWVGFTSGYRVDVDAVVRLAHDAGCLVMLDAIQGLGAFPIDVRATPVDFLCADGHKWMLGPEGAGLLYVRDEHLDLLQPLGVGWNSLQSAAFDPRSSKLKRTAARYEGGSSNMPGMLGLGASLKLLVELRTRFPGARESAAGGATTDGVAEAVLENVATLERRLTDAGFTVHLPEDHSRRSGIVGIGWPEADREGDPAYGAARMHCVRSGVALSVRGGRLRASTHAYNNDADIDRLVNALIEHRG